MEVLPCPPGLEGEKRKVGRKCRSSAPARGAGEGGGARSSGVDPLLRVLGCLVALVPALGPMHEALL